MRRWCCLLGCLLLCLVAQVAAQTPTLSPAPLGTGDATPTPPTSLLVITPTPSPPNVANLTFITYTTTDRSFAFEHPSDWIVTEEDYQTTFTAPLSVGDLSFTAFNPRVIAILTQGQPDAVSALRNLRETYFGFIPDNISPTTVGWREAALAPVIIGERGRGVAMLMEMSRGGYGLVFAVTTQGQLNGFLPLIDTMLRRYDSPGNRRLATREQPTLTNFSGARETIIASLATQKIIKQDVTLLDTLDEQVFSGGDSQFKPMAERLPTNTALMIGEMAFSPKGGSYESCAFVLHIVPAEAGDPDQTLRHYLEVGFDQAGTLYYFDAGRNEERVIDADLRQGLSLDRPYMFVLLLANERMTIYLNGVNVADNVLVRGIAGSAGVSMRPSSPETQCLFRNVALYRMTPLPAGLCMVAPREFANSRIAPTTTAALGTRLTAETPQQVMAYTAPAGSRLRWWKLQDSTWVREDGVEETGDCDNLPLGD